jgi:hypothetical protein
MTNLFSLLGAKLAPVVSGLKLRSPQILLGVGIATAVGSVAAAVVATTKLDEVKAETAKRLEEVDEALQDETLKEKYSEADAANDRKIIKIQGGAKIAAMYLPAAALLACSIAAFAGGHHILMLRNGALSAAFATMSAMFENYRKNVVDKYGADADAALRGNVISSSITGTVIDADGTEHTLTKTVEESRVDEAYDFARFYIGADMNNMHDVNYDETFLRAQQTTANELLQARHILLLNDVYELLGFKKTKAGAMVGWIWDPKRPYGDNYVDFRMRLTSREDRSGELQPAYFLDFNVAGSILDAAVERGLIDA